MADENGAQAGNPDETSTANGDQGQTPGGVNPFAELDEVTRKWVEDRHGNDVSKLAKQAYELDKFAGRAVAVPGNDATPEDWDKFFAKIGRPETPDAYSFTPPESMPETVAYNNDLAKGFKEVAHKEGLRPDQAAHLHDWFVSQIIPAVEAEQGRMAQDLEAQITEANERLTKAWGDPKSETFQANLELAARFWDAVDENGGLLDVLSKRGLIGPDREVLVPELAFAFAKAGAAIFTEGGTLNGAGDSLIGENPFDAEKGNLTQAMALIKRDPNKALTLAKAAGVDSQTLKAYGLI